MKTIFSRTLETTLSKAAIILCTIVGLVTGLIINKAACSYEAGAFTRVVSELTTIQHLIFFFAIDGLLIALTIENASGIIANEVHEGTFRLLIAKPNSRREVLLGKILGTFTGLMILQLLMALSYYSMVSFGGCIDGNVAKELFRYFFPYLLYGLIVILIWMGFSTILTVVFKRKITAMLPLLALLIITLAFFPIERLVSTLAGKDVGNFIYYIDTNYQFSLIFRSCVELVDKIPAMEPFVYLNNLLTQKWIDTDLSLNEISNGIIYENDFFNGYVVTAIYLIASLICTIVSFVLIRKKDV